MVTEGQESFPLACFLSIMKAEMEVAKYAKESRKTELLMSAD